MKCIILILFLINSNLFAGEAYILKSEFMSKVITKSFTSKSDCEKISPCIKVGDKFNLNFSKLIPEQIDDLSKPINTKNDIQVCSNKADCQLKQKSKVCTDKSEHIVIGKLFKELYCTKISGYQQKLSGRDIIVEDSALRATYDSAQAAKASSKLLLDKKISKIKAGTQAIAYVGVLLDSKNLTAGQTMGIMADAKIKPIMGLLQSGSLTTARGLVAAYVPDANFSSADISKILAKLDELIALNP